MSARAPAIAIAIAHQRRVGRSVAPDEHTYDLHIRVLTELGELDQAVGLLEHLWDNDIPRNPGACVCWHDRH